MWLKSMYSYFLNLRILFVMMIYRVPGIPMYMSSLRITRFPLSLKKLPIPIGETLIGLQSKKWRVSSQGEKKATPNPPVVIASRIA